MRIVKNKLFDNAYIADFQGVTIAFVKFGFFHFLG